MVDDEDGFACKELTVGLRRSAWVVMPRKGNGALELGSEVAAGRRRREGHK